MPGYDRLFTLAVLACLVGGALSFAVGDPLKATLDFVAVALGVRLDDRLSQRWWLAGEMPRSRWQRMRRPSWGRP